MEQSATIKRFILLFQLAAIMMLMPAGVATAADAITLAASEPAVIYYTTNGATPVAPTSNTTATSTAPAIETFSLVPNAGKGTSYKKPEKLKIHESKRAFEKHVKEKHGKRFKVDRFNVKQTEDGLEGSIRIVENRDPAIFQLGERCTEEEWLRRVAITKDFIVNNPELIGLTENEELRVLKREKKYCGNVYFDRFINGYELSGSGLHFVFVPQYNYSVSVDLDPITPEMYEAAQQQALSEEEVATIVYKDLNIATSGKAVQKLPELRLRKYLIKKEPYVIWKVGGPYAYQINALTGEIIRKVMPIVY